MTIFDLIAQPDLVALLSRYSVIVYTGSGEYPLSFFAHVMRILRSRYQCVVEVVDVKEHDLESIKSRVEISFLGRPIIFWFKSLDLLEEKKKKRVLSHLNSYAGPNVIMLYTEDGKNALEAHGHVLVEMPVCVDSVAIQQLLQFLHIKPSSAGMAMLARIVKSHPKITLDQAIHVIQYAPVISSGDKRHVDELIQSLVGADQSLFTLSALLFARQQEAFFKAWSEVHDHYQEVFWCSFWSEQLWRAACFVRLAQEQAMLEAKKISSRLPFSFIQKDWKLHHQHELVRAHEYVYSIDFAFKNGNEAPLIELFYVKFFAKEFDER